MTLREIIIIVWASTIAIVMTVFSYNLGWAQRGDAIYSAMFNQSVATMKPLHDKLK